jgi:hypothetical protein
VLAYPVSENLVAADGTPYTGVVVQYAADAITHDGHLVFQQLDAVKHQYGCFFASQLATGHATLVAPDSACF